MKKFPTLFLAAVLLLGLLSGCQQTQTAEEITPALRQAAQDLLAESGQPTDQADRVAEDLRLLSVTILGQLVQVETITQEGITYAIDYPDTGVTELLQVAAQEDGSTTVTITDGERTDVFTYQTNGKIRLNGETLSDCKPLAGKADPEKAGLVYQVEAAPTTLLAQAPPYEEGVEDLVLSEAYTFVDTTAYVKALTLPTPAEELTLSALLNILGTHAANDLQKAMANPTAAGFPAAVGQALAENREKAAAVFRSKGAEDPPTLSYLLHRYAGPSDTHLYVINTYANSYWYGESFLWGVLETGQAP